MSTSTEAQAKPAVQRADSAYPGTLTAMASVMYTLWHQFPGANGTAEAWRVVVQLRHQSVCLIFSGLTMPTLDVAKSAYVLADTPGAELDLLLIGTCSEVSVEQASVFGWMHSFGATAPLKELQKKFGFTPDAVAAAAKEELAKAQ